MLCSLGILGSLARWQTIPDLPEASVALRAESPLRGKTEELNGRRIHSSARKER